MATVKTADQLQGRHKGHTSSEWGKNVVWSLLPTHAIAVEPISRLQVCRFLRSCFTRGLHEAGKQLAGLKTTQ